MKKIFVPVIILIISSYPLNGCSSKNTETKQETNITDSAVQAKNYINTDIDEDKKGNKYISIFYSVSGLTSEEGEELNIALKEDKTNNSTTSGEKDKISSLTFINRENTKIEQIDLKNTEKIQKILKTLKALNVSNKNDKKTIDITINLLNQIK